MMDHMMVRGGRVWRLKMSAGISDNVVVDLLRLGIGAGILVVVAYVITGVGVALEGAPLAPDAAVVDIAHGLREWQLMHACACARTRFLVDPLTGMLLRSGVRVMVEVVVDWSRVENGSVRHRRHGQRQIVRGL